MIIKPCSLLSTNSSNNNNNKPLLRDLQTLLSVCQLIHRLTPNPEKHTSRFTRLQLLVTLSGNQSFPASASFGRDQNHTSCRQVSSAEPEPEPGTHLSIRLSPHFLTPSVRTGSDGVQHVVVLDPGRHPGSVVPGFG